MNQRNIRLLRVDYVECKQQFSYASYYNYMRIPHQRYNDDMVLFTRK